MTKKLNVVKDSPWYANGLPFKCTGCGKCCTGAPGYVWVNEEEMQAISEYLNLAFEDFTKKFVREVKGRFSLIEHPKTYDCVFLKDNKCQIYPVRPTQCRTYPWWPQLLQSEEQWKDAASYCEGILYPNAPVVQAEVIQEQLKMQIESNPPIN